MVHYRHKFTKIIREVFIHNSEYRHNFFFPEDLNDISPLFILVSSNKGFCGGFNSKLIQLLNKELFTKKKKNASYITIGSKAFNAARNNQIKNIVLHYQKITISTLPSITGSIVKEILSSQRHYSSVTIFSNIMPNFFTRIPQKKIFIPFTFNELKETLLHGEKKLAQRKIFLDESTIFDNEPIYEQAEKETICDLAIRYIKVGIFDLLLESLQAEQAARFQSMNNSTTNAEKYLDELVLSYNKTRQMLITQEVAEISAGFFKST